MRYSTQHDFGQDCTCRYCGANIDTESMVCEVRALAHLRAVEGLGRGGDDPEDIE